MAYAPAAKRDHAHTHTHTQLCAYNFICVCVRVCIILHTIRSVYSQREFNKNLKVLIYLFDRQRSQGGREAGREREKQAPC